MKTNFKRIGKQSISIVLAVMMMLSTMLVGMVTSNAADTFTKGSTLYFDTKAINQGNERWAAYFFNSNTDNAWVDCTAVPDDNKIYSVTVPESYANVIFCRMDKAQTENGWGNMLWNQSNDLKASEATGNEYVSTGWVSGSNKFTGEWKTYADPNTTHKVTANFSNATVKLGNDPLTSGTPKTVDNNTDYTLTVTPDEGYTLTSVKFGDTEKDTSGTYTLAAGTDDVTIDITTENSTENDYDFYVTGYMNGNDLTTSNNYKFTKESNGIYTCTMTPTDNLYVTITDNNSRKVYWSASYEELSENTYSTKTVVESGGDKWGILKQAGKEIKITFNITAGIENGKIKWEYAAAQYKIDVDKNITNGKVTPSATSLAADETFTVTATPDKGYELETVTVKDAKGNSVPATNESTHTYKMPASNVTVSATFRVKTDAKYSVTYTDPTGSVGVVSASINPTEAELVAGLAADTPVTVTVTVNEGYTASLAVDGKTVTPSISGNTYTFTFSMPAQNITVAPQVTKAGGTTDNEIQGLYLIYGNSNDPRTFTEHTKLYVDSSNQVFAYFTSGENLDTKKDYYFLISTSTGENSYLNAYINNNNRAFNDKKYDDVVTTRSQEYYIGSDPYYSGKFTVNEGYRDTVSSVKINLGYYNETTGVIQENATDTTKAFSYEVIPTSGVEGMVQVFAKDGTIRTTYQKYADMADTVLENGADLTKYDKTNAYYETASAKVGTKLKIKTTILPEYRKKYFVKAFSINGYSYGIIDASQAKKQNGVYTCEYTIPEDFEGKRIEITPIYYYIDDTDTVTFYVEGFDAKVQEMWGNTIAVQAWYANCEKEDDSNNSKFNSPTKNALGGYPGQPMVYQGGKYSMQIPKYLNGVKANYVKGITLNNYFWDDIHKQSFTVQSNEYNCQTYDFDDFYKLSETPDVDNIIFDFRYRTTTDNAPSPDGLSSSNYNQAELEPLKDYYGNIVNIFGNILSEDWKDDYKSNYLTVISDGYKPNDNIGKYATEWSVYDQNGNYITAINCSSLIDEKMVDTSSYKAAYDKLKPYANLPVMIAYEKSKFDGTVGEPGTRADGRWYFSKKTQKITANVQIECGTDVNSVFNVDEFKQNSNVGKKTGAKAYFTNADYIGKTTCDGTVDGGNFSVHAETDANANYYFLGWYLKTSDGYSFITNESDADFPMTNNETYVARFINTPSGTLTLSHTLLDGSAYGKTFIKADIVDSNGDVKASIDETSGNLVIPSNYVTYTSTDSIRLTLRTVPYGNDTVEGFYEGYSSDKPVRYNKDFTDTGEQTYSVTRDIKDLFVKINNTDGSVSHNLKKSNIPFYSNIKSNPLEYTITYTYDTRRDDRQSYVIKDKVSGIELEQMWKENVEAGLDNKYQLSKAFIIRKAPFVSNYREEITWIINDETIKGYTATVSANTKTVDLKIYALTVNGQWTQPATVKYGELAKSNGDYLYKTGTTEFPETFNGYDFSFWAIFDNKEKADQYRKEVVAYMSGKPAEVMSDRLTALTKLKGYDNLISKSYSKEYNYISYQDYYIVPVYAGRFAKDQIKESQASIRLLEYTRNQWTNENGVNGNGKINVGGSKIDYLYTDFALSFDKDQLLIKDNTNIKVGIAFEIVAKYDAVKDDLKSFETPSNTAAIGDKVKAATANGKVGTYEMDGASRSIYRYEINNSDISVKNRIEYYLQFKNNNNAQQNVMKVYSYIYDTKSNEIYLSDPVYMNMYDIGNLTYITSDLASIDLQPATELG